MSSISRTVRRALALAALACAPTALARDGDGSEPKPAPAAPDDAASKPDAAQLLRRMTELYPRALQRPQSGAGSQDADPLKARAAAAKAEKQWDGAIRDLAQAGDDYLAALGGAAPDARALFYRGAGKSLLATRVAVAEQRPVLEAAAESLTSYLAAVKEGDGFRADAEAYLGRALLSLAGRDASRVDPAIEHLRAAVLAFQRDGRPDDAGTAAYLALAQLLNLDRRADARALADVIHARDADFGASTPSIRLLASGSAVAVGSPVPALPAGLADVDGNALDLARGPLLLHFFLTGYPHGKATSFKDVETDVRPLWDRWHEKGLRVVGVCMDYEVPREKAEATRKLWKDEWGLKDEYRDGSLAMCRTWAVARGIAWPWYWDGKWMRNPVSTALGGVGVNEPYVLFVDAEGVVRWCGRPPYEGLADAVARALTR